MCDSVSGYLSSCVAVFVVCVQLHNDMICSLMLCASVVRSLVHEHMGVCQVLVTPAAACTRGVSCDLKCHP